MSPAIAVVILVAASGLAAPAGGQGGTSPTQKKPNIAVSGCMLRQGYATLVLDEARVDGKGAAAATAEPSDRQTAVPAAPPRWMLENAGTLARHVGERVQVIGTSDWVTNPDEYPVPSGEPGPPPRLPSIDVISLKVLAASCS